MLTILRKEERKVFIQGGTKRTSEFKTTIITFILIVQYKKFIYINTTCKQLNFKIKFFFSINLKRCRPSLEHIILKTFHQSSELGRFFC